MPANKETIRKKIYDKENTRTYRFKLNKKTDADIMQMINNVSNVQGYIKELIRKDISERNHTK